MSVRLGTQKITDIVKTSEGTGGTSDYNDLVNKPQINGTVLQGNLTTDDLGIEIPKVDAYTKQETTDLINSAVSDKATIEYVDDNLNLKADKTELEKELASKADINNVYTKEDTDAEIDKKIINKADKTYVDDALDLKADISNVYTKQESDNKLDNLNSSINNKLASKADITSVYTKEETATVINNAIANKADKTYVDDALGLKADKEDTYTKSEIDDMFDNPTITGDTYPIGAIAPFAGVTTPQNWLLCDGREVSREVYSELFAVIGTTWGAGDGSTSFNLPDLRNRMPVGAGDDYTLASKGGEKTHKMTIKELVPHTHTTGHGTENGGSSYDVALKARGFSSSETEFETSSTGEGEPFSIMPPYVGTYYIIKAKQSAGVIATVVDNLSSTSPTDALSANMGKVLADKLNKNAITLQRTGSTQSIGTAYEVIQFNNTDAQIGNGLTVSSTGVVKVGAGISAVRISYYLNLANSNNPQVPIVHILKNGINLHQSAASIVGNTNSNFPLTIANYIVEVSENDLISIEISGNTANVTIRNGSFMTIESI